jgi:hypothetical protein
MIRPTVKLIGADGNAFSILGLCKQAARKAGWHDTEWLEFQRKCMQGDYDHLLRTVMEHFDVE